MYCACSGKIHVTTVYYNCANLDQISELITKKTKCSLSAPLVLQRWYAECGQGELAGAKIKMLTGQQ